MTSHTKSRLQKKPRIYKSDGLWVMETKWDSASYPYRTMDSDFKLACSWAALAWHFRDGRGAWPEPSGSGPFGF